MPQVAEKTPIFDVVVHMTAGKSGKSVKAVERVLYDEAEAIQARFKWHWPGKYGADATTIVNDKLFVFNNITYVEIVRSQNIITYEWGYPVTEPAFLEDDE